MMKLTPWMILSALLLVQPDVMAADKQDKAARRASILMQKMKQDMDAEKSAMQTQFDQEKKGITEALNQAHSAERAQSARLQGQTRRNQALQAETQQLNQDKAALATQLQQLQASLDAQHVRLEAVEQQLKEAKSALDVNDAQRKVLVSNVAATHQQLSACETKNAHLFDVSQELISLYADASPVQKMLRTEPFLQLKRVELENILQDTRQQLMENKVDTMAGH